MRFGTLFQREKLQKIDRAMNIGKDRITDTKKARLWLDEFSEDLSSGRS